MTKKSVGILLASIFILAIISSQALAQNETEILKAYSWLGTKVKTKALWDDLNVKQHVFSLLALSCNESHVELGNKSLYDKAFKLTTMCWGKKTASTPADCEVTETAMAKMAADELELFDTEKADKWLLNQSKFFDDIFWFLELDVERDLTAECRISYDGTNVTVFINENKTLSNLSSTTCFNIYDKYWLSINKNCYEKSFKIRCIVSDSNKEFRATLKYKKTSSVSDNTWYVSSESNVSASGQEWETALQSYCLADPVTKECDYEGTAWASYTLKGTEEVEKFIPYLIIGKEDNENYLPESLLYLLGLTRYGDELQNIQNQQGFWKAQPNTVYGQFYDTALGGMTGLGNLSDIRGGARYYLTVESDKARTFIEKDGKYRYWKCVESGCEEIRDTAFLLWVFWPEYCSGAGGTCESRGFNCKESCLPDEYEETSLSSTCPSGEVCCSLGIVEGCEEKGGHCLDTYICPDGEFEVTTGECESIFELCCKKYGDATCNEFGSVCGEDQDCTLNTVKDADGVECCPGECFPKSGNRSCSDLYGAICYTGEVCMNEDPWEESVFVPANDTAKCCIGTCIEDKTCYGSNGIGACGAGETCSGTVVETTDEQYCCIGTCAPTKTCAQMGGAECKSPSTCSTTVKAASDTNYCCIGTCSKKKSLWWLWLLIIIVILAGITIYLLKFRKTKKKKPSAMPPGMMMPPRRPLTPIGAPVTKPAPFPFKPMPMAPSRTAVRPAPKMPVRKTSSKTEAELEKTLKKLKGMTKK